VGGVVESFRSAGSVVVTVGGCSSWWLLLESQKGNFAMHFAIA